MSSAKIILNVFRNKYIIASTAFIFLMLFIDHNDIFVQLDRQRQLKALLISKNFYQQQIDQTKKNLSDLQNNPAALEKYAREKYLLKRENEDLFVVSSQENQKKSADKQ